MNNADACHWMLRLKVLEGDITKQKVDAITWYNTNFGAKPSR